MDKNIYRLGLYEKAMPNEIVLQKKLEAVRAAGFDAMEISIDETEEKQARLHWSRNERIALRHMVEEAQCPIDSMCLSGHRKWPLGSKAEATRDRGRDIFRRAVDFAHEVGIRVIQLAGYDVCYEPSDALTRERFWEGLQEGVEYAAQYGVLCGFETMETPFMDMVAKAMTYVRYTNSPYLGVYPDLGNLTNTAALYQNDVREDILCGKGKILAMHVKETREGQYRDMRFGEGWVDFPKGIHTAYQAGVRYFVAETWYQGDGDWVAQIAEANRFVRAAFETAMCRPQASTMA